MHRSTGIWTARMCKIQRWEYLEVIVIQSTQTVERPCHGFQTFHPGFIFTVTCVDHWQPRCATRSCGAMGAWLDRQILATANSVFLQLGCMILLSNVLLDGHMGNWRSNSSNFCFPGISWHVKGFTQFQIGNVFLSSCKQTALAFSAIPIKSHRDRSGEVAAWILIFSVACHKKPKI